MSIAIIKFKWKKKNAINTLMERQRNYNAQNWKKVVHVHDHEYSSHTIQVKKKKKKKTLNGFY